MQAEFSELFLDQYRLFHLPQLSAWSKTYMDLSWHTLKSKIQVKTHCHDEKQGISYLWL